MSASVETNRIHFVGAARIMCIYGENSNLLKGQAGGATGGYVLGVAEKMATAQAWDAYCRSRGKFATMRGIPGGVLSLKALEHVSPKFTAWLDQPYTAPDGAKRED